MKELELLIVYNADNGFFATISDFAHKILSPATYQCALCSLTYGNFSIKKDWKSFVEHFPVKTTFLHRNEFVRAYKIEINLPAMFIQSEKGIEMLLSKREIEGCRDVAELKLSLVQKYKAYVEYHRSDL
jgi:hypothetical protein